MVDTFQLKGIDKVSSVKIYDMSGRLVKQFTQQTSYNVSSLAKGVYTIIVEANHTKKSFQVIKK